ncbi:centrosomal protein of 290 kDa-like [Bacillus rossius redtenbacheri]|uniref:centrosomal protein of 290 kDa-like n=1 Tax=Bacillus rossius redtenbacheri TaxID=93214 RepID=UPI002FDD8D31
MVQLDWKKLSAISLEELTEEEKDDFYDTLIWYTPEADVGEPKLRLLYTVAQELLKYKGNQVESLISELDDLATQHGKDEAGTHRALLEEIQDLQAQLVEYQSTRAQHTDVVASMDVEELRQALVRAQLHNEELISEMKAVEKNLLAEKQEVEKYASQVVTLEQEKVELRRELSAVQNEISEQFEATLRQDSPELTAEKHRELVESIRHKNKHISQLLNDVEKVEGENEALREKLVSLRDELSEAARQMTEVAGELASLKLTCQEKEEKLTESSEEILALRTQVKELVEQKLLRDTHLDHFSEALDARVQEWKRVLEEKDAMIEELQSRLSLVASQAPSTQIDAERSKVALLMQALQKREDQIDLLRDQLENATREMEKSAGLIEKLKPPAKSKKSVIHDVDAEAAMKLKLDEAEKKISQLEEELKSSDEDARVKAEELAMAVARLRQYESGEYGLAQAVEEIKELRAQMGVRERHIQQLVQEANRLHAALDELEERNFALREKLGLSADDEVPIGSIVSQRKKEKLLMQVLQQQSERLQDEKLQLQLKNRKLVKELEKLQGYSQPSRFEPDLQTVNDTARDKQLVAVVDPSKDKLDEVYSQHAGELTLDKESAADHEERNLSRAFAFLEDKLRGVTKENEALRVGMHEILDSIRSQDGSSDVRLESECLERLLEALDARHISGWYHPAMRLQAQVHALEGSNSALREQLRALRLEEVRGRGELQVARTRAKEMEGRTAVQGSQPGAAYREAALPPDTSLSSAELLAQLNSHLLRVLNEFNKECEMNKALKTKLEEFGKEYNVLHHQQGLLYQHYGEEKVTWEEEARRLEKDKLSLRGTVEELQSKVEELESNLTAVAAGEGETRQLAESARRAAEFREKNTQLERKLQALQDNEKKLEQENEKLNMQIIEMESTVTSKINELTRQKEVLSFQVKSLQSSLQDSVPLHVLEEASRQQADVVAKYTDLLQREQILLCEKQYSEWLQAEVETLQSNKCELERALQEAKEKLHLNEALVSVGQETVTKDTHDDQIVMLSKKLAALEVQLTHEKQKADHAEKMFSILKEQITQLEERNTYLESSNADLVKETASLQQAKELQNSLSVTMDLSEIHQVKEKCTELEKELLVLRQESDRRREVADVARRQVRALELGQAGRQLQLEFARRQVLDLQSASDDKMTIGRLGHEVLTAKLAEMAASKKAEHLKSEVIHLKTVIMKKEGLLDEKEKEVSQLRIKLISCCRSFQQLSQGFRRQSWAAAAWSGREQHSRLLHRWLREQQGLRERAARAEEQAHAAAAREQELRLRLQAAGEPSVDGSRSTTEPHLAELRSQRKVKFLELQLKQMEEKASKQEEYISVVENELADLQKNWEQAQLLWQQTQLLESQERADVKITSQDIASTDHLKGTSEPSKSAREELQQAMCLVGNQVQSLLKYEAELIQLKEKVLLLSKEVEVKDSLLQKKDAAILDVQIEPAKLQDTCESSSEQPHDKLALKVTLESLQTIVSQKEETISHYKNLLKEARAEHREASAKLQEEVQALQMALVMQEQECNRLKGGPAGPLQPSLAALQRQVQRNQQLQEEAEEMRAAAAQLGACRQEADRWRRLAEDRLFHLGEMRRRLEEQHRSELQTYQEEAQSCREERDALEQQLVSAHEELGHGPSAILKNTVAVLKAQLQERDGKMMQMSQTVLNLQNQLKKQIKAEKTSQTQSVEDLQQSKSLKEQLSTLMEENKKLKDQLNIRQRRPRRDVSAERVASAVEEDLKKKVAELEEKLKEKSDTDNAAEAKRLKSAEEIARWNERKKWQQAVEKLKVSEKEKANEVEKLQKTIQGLRSCITRLEKEKNVLSARLKTAKGADNSQLERLELERCRLETEVAVLRSKLEAQQRHSSGLGAAILEERLEAQQHRIAALELAKKGDMAVVEELQKAKEANSVLERANLRLESENLEQRLELEKIPQLREQVQHLEKSVSILKEENLMQQRSVTVESENRSETRKTNRELQKTILAMKRVVETLQEENKHLKQTREANTSHTAQEQAHRGKSGLQTEAEVDRNERYSSLIKQNKDLGCELESTRQHIKLLEERIQSLRGEGASSSDQVALLQAQLSRKTQILDRVKVLLKRAAVKERSLLDQVKILQSLIPDNVLQHHQLSTSQLGGGDGYKS